MWKHWKSPELRMQSAFAFGSSNRPGTKGYPFIWTSREITKAQSTTTTWERDEIRVLFSVDTKAENINVHIFEYANTLRHDHPFPYGALSPSLGETMLIGEYFNSRVTIHCGGGVNQNVKLLPNETLNVLRTPHTHPSSCILSCRRTMFGWFNLRHIRASRSSFWKSLAESFFVLMIFAANSSPLDFWTHRLTIENAPLKWVNRNRR